ncbi:MAG: hypothetical protein ACJ79T_02050, partial [Myxococcales bacterium]
MPSCEQAGIATQATVVPLVWKQSAPAEQPSFGGVFEQAVRPPSASSSWDAHSPKKHVCGAG